MQPTIYQQVLGAPFFNLPTAPRALHSVRGRFTCRGRASVERGRNPLAWLCAVIAGLPPSMRDAPLRLDVDANEKREIWKRDFDGRKFASKLWARDGLLCERLGPIQFRFELHSWEGTLYWNVAKARLFGLLPLPARLFSGVQCREREVDERYEFEVAARLPLIGLLIRYEGWLVPV